MAAELKHEFQVVSSLEPGGGGVFDVTVNGQLIFRKHDEGDRFPNPGEIGERLRAAGLA